MSDLEIIQLRRYQLPGRGIKIHWPLLGAQHRHPATFAADRSVAALRLTEKGYRVGVFESGRRWDADSLPKSNWNARKSMWAPGRAHAPQEEHA
jgi:hypothetical protein